MCMGSLERQYHTLHQAEQTKQKQRANSGSSESEGKREVQGQT
jgi:hypothetical protein